MAYQGILPEVPSFAQSLARNLGAGLTQGLGSAGNFTQQMMLEKQKGSSLANTTKQMEKIKNLETGLGTISRMRELISSAGPSNLVQSFLGVGETREKRAELESLGRSLIPLVSAGVPIRNQKEFEEYRKIITNPNARQADLEGALNGIENLLSRSVQDSGSSYEKQEQPTQKKSSGDMVKVQAPDGSIRSIPKDKVKSAMQAGGKVVK